MPEATAEPEGKVKQQPDPAPKSGFKLEDLGFAGTVLAAIGGGIGALGLVAFFGAAILWVRMDQARLPGNDAVAVVPKSVLIATGASFLVPALLIALAFTVVLYLVDALVAWRGKRSQRKVEGRLGELRESQQIAYQKAQALRDVVKVAEEDRDTASELDATPVIVEAKAEDRVRSASEEAAAASEQSVLAKEEMVTQEKRLKEEESRSLKRIETKQKWILTVATILLFVVLAVLMVNAYSIHRSPQRDLILVAVAVLLTTFCVVVRLQTKSFGWFGVAAFLAVGLMIGALTYYRTVDDPKVEPAAVLRTHGAPVFGFYVSQTSDRVYLGIKPRSGAARLDAIPREEVADLVVGNLQTPTVAAEHAITFARRLCLEARERKPTGKIAGTDGGGKTGEEVASGCTAADLRRLSASSGS